MTALRIFNRSEIREEGHAKEDFTDGAFREAGVREFDEKSSMLRHFHTIAAMAISASILSMQSVLMEPTLRAAFCWQSLEKNS